MHSTVAWWKLEIRLQGAGEIVRRHLPYRESRTVQLRIAGGEARQGIGDGSGDTLHAVEDVGLDATLDPFEDLLEHARDRFRLFAHVARQERDARPRRREESDAVETSDDRQPEPIDQPGQIEGDSRESESTADDVAPGVQEHQHAVAADAHW